MVRPGGSFRPATAFDGVRAGGNRLLEDYLSPDCAEMAKAVLLGEREQVEDGLTEDFMAAGVIHLLVIAGLHIGILAAAVWWLVRRTPLSRGSARRWSRPPPWPTCCWSTPGLQSCGQRFWCW